MSTQRTKILKDYSIFTETKRCQCNSKHSKRFHGKAGFSQRKSNRLQFLFRFFSKLVKMWLDELGTPKMPKSKIPNVQKISKVFLIIEGEGFLRYPISFSDMYSGDCKVKIVNAKASKFSTAAGSLCYYGKQCKTKQCRILKSFRMEVLGFNSIKP